MTMLRCQGRVTFVAIHAAPSNLWATIPKSPHNWNGSEWLVVAFGEIDAPPGMGPRLVPLVAEFGRNAALVPARYDAKLEYRS